MDKQVIREFIHKSKRSATEDEKRLWRLLQMWNDTRSFKVFDEMVRFSLKDTEKELKKPCDKNDAFEVNWRGLLERDVKVYGNIVKWLDEQKGQSDGTASTL